MLARVRTSAPLLLQLAQMSSAPSPNVEINPNVHERAVMHTSAMEWRPSPDARVWRRRVYLRGTDVEGSHVSGVVRFEPGSSFHSHPHPRGEEILVLSGVFSDQRGDHGAGSFLLNPEGFEHAPHSEQGCELFVRLRQYAGHDRPQLAIHTDQLPWLPSEHAGVAFKQLFADERWPDVATLQRYELACVLLCVCSTAADDRHRFSLSRTQLGAWHATTTRTVEQEPRGVRGRWSVER